MREAGTAVDDHLRVSAAPKTKVRHPAWILRLTLVAVATAAVGAAMCIAVASLMWLTSVHDETALRDAVRAGALLWVAAQGAPVSLAAISFSLMPWGLGLVCGLVLLFGSRRVARGMNVTSWRDFGWVAGGVLIGSAVYALLAGWAADLTWLPGARVSPVDGAVHAGLLALIAMGTGVLLVMHEENEDTGRQRFPVIPPLFVVALRAGAIGALLLLGIGALAVALSLMAHFDDSVTLIQSLAVGPGGALGLILLCLAYLPVIVVWGAAYLLGGGVVIGAGAIASPFISVTPATALPPVPLLAAIPQQATPLAWLSPVLAIACGLAVGLSVARGLRGSPRLLRAVMAVVASAVTGLVIFVAGTLASGSLGEQRLAYVGPVPLTMAIMAFVLVLLGAVPTSVLGAERSRKKHLTVAPVVVADEVPVVDA